jgi:HAD superfamily hydrolase (TIGR01549 family)
MSDSPDTVVFDLDGTLMDSNYHHAIAWSRAFQRHGLSVAVWDIHRHIGMGGDRLVAAVAGDDAEEQHGDDLRDAWEHEYDALAEEARPLAGARELLAELGRRGLAVVLASSGIPKHTKRALELLHADEHTDAATTGDDAEASKPDPELLDEALARVGASGGFMVGDAVWDVVAANEEGMPTVGLLSGGYGRAELLDAGAVAVYRDPADLLEHLDEALAAVAGVTEPR